MNLKAIKYVLAMCLVCLVFSVPLRAGGGATLSGTITDATGAVIPNAQITSPCSPCPPRRSCAVGTKRIAR